MAWDGYFTYDTTEIINAPRTEAYAADRQWFRPLFKNTALAPMLGDAAYVDPVTDGAPWVDPDEPGSGGFFGFYPIGVSGLENSSRSSTVIESTIDGGVSGRLRHGTKTVVFNGLLMGVDEVSVEYGLRWLTRALLGRVCSNNLSLEHALGHDLTFFASEPVLDTSLTTGPEVALTGYQRSLRRFVINGGPSVTSKREMECGGHVWAVQFTGVAGVPYQFGATKPIVQGYMSPTVTDPWAPDATPGYFDTAGFTWTEVECGVDLWEPIFDPLCPALLAPPLPPSVPLGCADIPSTWRRRKVEIPAANVPLWGSVVPTLTVFAPQEIRNLRIRFYEDPDGDADPSDNPCSFVGDAVISYIPANARFVLDGVEQAAYVITEMGHRRRADSLLYQTDGTPFEWPHLSCGFGHILTLDLPETETDPVVDVALTARTF